MATSPDVGDQQRSDGMVIEKDVTFDTRDGHTLYCDVFRPDAEGQFPVILSFGVYGKDFHFAERDDFEYKNSPHQGPYMNYETPDALTWVGFGYVVIRVDPVGTGKSPGVVDVFSDRDAEHYYDAIEWAAVQPWSTGNVGTLGVSYYAHTQTQVAAKKPPHLKAIVPWEVAGDIFRDAIFTGGILNNNFPDGWFEYWVKLNQNGLGTLSEEELARNRVDWPTEIRRHPLWDEYWAERQPDPRDIDVPILTVANFTGLPLVGHSHYELFEESGSPYKWLRVHSGGHVANFYSPESTAQQRQFLDYFLKGEDNGLLDVPRVQLAIRHKGTAKRQVCPAEDLRYENEWPLARTRWTELFLDAGDMSLAPASPTAADQIQYSAQDSVLRVPMPSASQGFNASGYGSSFVSYPHYVATMTDLDDPSTRVLFRTAPFAETTEITGPLVLTLHLSTTGEDADIFVTGRAYDEDGQEITFDGLVDNPDVPMTVGHLRLSQRTLDPVKSTAWRPYRRQDRSEPVEAGKVYEVRIAVGPTSMIFEPGYTLGVEVGSRDGLGTYCYNHNDPDDRARATGTVTIHTGPESRSSLLVPVIPADA
ncbi:CocE/NonD family hydrolase [Streptomyces sp. NPDC093085]|uniref:CocE/NonD family hydrolase n=1 Tax=Streptomyces sp. NPDC093085 TaxID=3155068 RepID=UPI003437ABCF